MNVISANNMPKDDEEIGVLWNENLATGIELIDNQHKNLIAMTERLLQACLQGGDKREATFKEVMSQMVEYVRTHFTTEQKLLQRINYPYYIGHTKEHDGLIKKVLEASKEYGAGNKSIANDFVKFLRDWIIHHIAHSDKMYAIYIAEQMKKGLLSSKDIEG